MDSVSRKFRFFQFYSRQGDPRRGQESRFIPFLHADPTMRLTRMALKQVWMFVIAHNLILYLINQARSAGANKPSFKGTLDTLANFSRSIRKPCSRFWHSCLEPVLKLIAEDPVPGRPGRVEPRCVKRRPKGYQLMTSPSPRLVGGRGLMVVSESRALK